LSPNAQGSEVQKIRNSSFWVHLQVVGFESCEEFIQTLNVCWPIAGEDVQIVDK
jgi:hypothetical protein